MRSSIVYGSKEDTQPPLPWERSGSGSAHEKTRILEEERGLSQIVSSFTKKPEERFCDEVQDVVSLILDVVSQIILWLQYDYGTHRCGWYSYSMCTPVGVYCTV